MRLLKVGTVAAIGMAIYGGELSAQDVYKCQINGALVYQGAPCGAAEIKGDAPWDRERARRALEQKAYEEAKRMASIARKERVLELRTCKRKDSECSAPIFSGYVVGLTQNELIEGLGEPDSTQYVGTTFWYYTLYLREGSTVKLRKVQMRFTGKTVDGADVY